LTRPTLVQSFHSSLAGYVPAPVSQPLACFRISAAFLKRVRAQSVTKRHVRFQVCCSCKQLIFLFERPTLNILNSGRCRRSMRDYRLRAQFLGIKIYSQANKCNEGNVRNSVCLPRAMECLVFVCVCVCVAGMGRRRCGWPREGGKEEGV
jgi:hypothetical protein